MSRSNIFKVIGNRIQFRCSSCNAKRSLSVPPYGRTRKVICHKCGTEVKCVLNRRWEQRQMQSGKAVMTCADGKRVEIDLFDISARGVGYTIPPTAKPAIALDEVVQFSCDWNPTIFPADKYIIRNIDGHRIGTESFN